MSITSGNNGSFRVDISTSAAGTAVTALPHCSEWSQDGSTTKIPVTCMGDSNEVELTSFKKKSVTINGYEDDTLDYIRTISDGVARKMLWCDDTTATTKRWEHGLYTFERSASGGVNKAKGFTLVASAAGSITEAFTTGTPSFP